MNHSRSFSRRWALFALGLLWLLGLAWYFAPVEMRYPWTGRYPEYDPDTMLYQRLLEQSILQGNRLQNDLYTAFPFEVPVFLTPFPLDLYIHLTRAWFALFPDSTLDSDLLLGSLPPLAGSFVVFLLLWFIWESTRNFSLAALVALACLPTFQPAITHRYMLLDHHWLESACIWTWLFCAWKFASTAGDRWMVAGGLACACFTITWLGSPLFFGVFMVYAITLWIFQNQKAPAILEFGGAGMLIGAGCVLLYVGANREYYGRWGLSLFGWWQPLIIGVGGMVLQGLSAIQTRWGKPSWRALLVAVLILGVLTGIGYWIDPSPFFQAKDFLLRKDPVVGSITETQSLYSNKTSILNTENLRAFFERFGVSVFFLLFLVLRSPSGLFDRSGGLLRDWMLIFLGMAVFQVRFNRWLGVGVGLLAGVFLYELFHLFRRAFEGERRAWGKTALALFPFLMIQLGASYSCIHSGGSEGDRFREALHWLSIKTPSTSGYSDANPPEYGILGFWDRGNMIGLYSHRPVVAGNNHIGIRRIAEVFTAQTEEEAYALCKRYRIRYIFLQGNNIEESYHRIYHQVLKSTPPNEVMYTFREPVPLGDIPPYGESFHSWLMTGWGLQAMGKFTGPASRFCLRFSSRTSRLEGFPDIVIFEVVEGAVLSGLADGGSKVTLMLPVQLSQSRASFQLTSVADSKGAFQLRVPYVTGYNGGRVTTGSQYQLHFLRNGVLARGTARVGETDLAEGKTVPVLVAD